MSAKAKILSSVGRQKTRGYDLQMVQESENVFVELRSNVGMFM
jgi:hypothetical protein